MRLDFLGEAGLTRLVKLIKAHLARFTTASFNSTDQILTLSNSNGTTNIQLETSSGYSVGDVIYKVGHTQSFLDQNKWALMCGQTLNKNEYPQLFDVIGYTYSDGTQVDTDHFRVPNVLSDAVLGTADSSSNFNEVIGSNTRNVAQGNLPNNVYYTVTNETSYDGRHNHYLELKRTNKSGTDTKTVLSYRESKYGDKYVYNKTDTDIQGGAHRHVFRLNPSGQTAVNVTQPTVGFGNYYIYTGGRTIE